MGSSHRKTCYVACTEGTRSGTLSSSSTSLVLEPVTIIDLYKFFSLSTKRGLFRVLELAATLVYEGARALLFDGVALKGTGEARHVFALRMWAAYKAPFQERC